MEIKQLKLNGTAFYPKVGIDSIVNADGTESAVDTVVTENSVNLVTSGAVYDAIQEGGGETVAWEDVTGKPDFKAVATSGSYADLTNKPTIPTKTSDLTNDSSFVNESLLSGKQDALVSGTNIKTINNQSILGPGNIDIQGGGSGSVNSVSYSNNAGDFAPDANGKVTLVIDQTLNEDSGKPVTNAAISTKFNSVDIAVSNVNATVTNMSASLVNHGNAITAIERVLWKDDENQIDKVNGRVDSLSSVVDSALTDIDDCVETIEISNNKLKYTTSGGVTPVDVATIDTVATQNSSNLITSGAVYNAVQQSGGGGTIDTKMSDSSTNAVQNGVITLNLLSITPIIKSESSFGSSCILVVNQLRINGTQINPWQKEGQATFDPALIEFTVGVVDINSATRVLNTHTFSYIISPGEGTDPTVSGREYNYQSLIDKFVSDLCEYYAGFSNGGSNSMIIRKSREGDHANVEFVVNITSTSLSTNHYQIILSSFELAGYDTTGKDNKVISLALTTGSTMPETRSDIFYKTMSISKGDLGTIVTNPQTLWFNTTINHLMMLDGQGIIYDCTTGSKFTFAPNYQ